ncbi:MAG: hypothetical protein H0U03_10385 [Actinobacteria bacterium]|nr:hypothetical protein [Actinomycetota bacterium]
MLVHSFGTTGEWFNDYEGFAALLGAEAKRDALVEARSRDGLRLYFGWVNGDGRHLTA